MSPTLDSTRMPKPDQTKWGRVKPIVQGRAGSKMWGVLLVPSSSPRLSSIFDGLDVNVTSNVTRFHLNHDMVSRQIYTLSSYVGHNITLSINADHGWRRTTSDTNVNHVRYALVLSPVGVHVWPVLLCVRLCAVLLCCGAGVCGYLLLIVFGRKTVFPSHLQALE